MWFRNNDPNNSQYFWINRRDLEIETKRNWQAIFDKCKDSSTQKYRKELTTNITFQPNKIFVTSNLFGKIIKSCKATNLEFAKPKEKLGLCFYEVICDEPEFISTSEEIVKEEKNVTQHDVKNKQLKEENEKWRKENETLRKENEQLRKTILVKDANIKESIEKPIEIKSPKVQTIELQDLFSSKTLLFVDKSLTFLVLWIHSSTFNLQFKVAIKYLFFDKNSISCTNS